MSLVKVWGNTSLNPAHVGKAEYSQGSDDKAQTRTSCTTVWDGTGQHVLLMVETTLSTALSNKDALLELQINNVLHDEIVEALHAGRNARTYKEVRAQFEREKGSN